MNLALVIALSVVAAWMAFSTVANLRWGTQPYTVSRRGLVEQALITVVIIVVVICAAVRLA